MNAMRTLATAAAMAMAIATERVDAQDVGVAVRGIVYDSIARTPLAGAVVQLMQLGRTVDAAERRVATTDSSGRYSIESAPAGSFMLGFFHPKLDSLGLEAVTRSLRGAPGDTLAIDLAVPSPRTIVAGACGGSAMRDSSGFVAGYVLAAGDDRPQESASVDARWSEVVIDGLGIHGANMAATAITGAGGWYGLCGVPPGALVLLRVATNADTGSFVALEMPDNGILLRSLYVATGESSPGKLSAIPASSRGVRALPAASTASPRLRAASALLDGLVTSQYGEPLANARVRLFGSTYETTTDAEGEFSLAGLPPGSHTLEARALGYLPMHVAVDLFPGRRAHASVTMNDFPTVIDTVRIRASRPRALTTPAGFDARRRVGYGTFFDAEQIEQRGPQQFSDLLRAVRGVFVTSTGIAGSTISMEGNNTLTACQPLIVIDGEHVPLNGMNINDLIPTTVVTAVEIYPRRLEAPPEFQTLDCGSIVVWTGARGWLAKRNGRASRAMTPKRNP